MKKLMIVAAVATMAGALVAADGYDFTASVKTTKGKAGSQKTTFTVNLGRDTAMWEDATLEGDYWWRNVAADEKSAKKYVAGLKNDEKRDFALDDMNYSETEIRTVKYGNKTYSFNKSDYDFPEYYKGKLQWCYTFKYTVTDTDCYRVAGSRKIKGIVYIDPACCEDGVATTWEYLRGDDVTFADADDDWDGYITPGILYRFGGVSLEKANKVEFAGVAGTTAFDGNPADSGNINTFALAGQGCWDVKNGYLKNISGNIVGVLANPDCENCCDFNKDACFFECDGLHSENDGSINGNEGTAAFGTFSLKYNKKY